MAGLLRGGLPGAEVFQLLRLIGHGARQFEGHRGGAAAGIHRREDLRRDEGEEVEAVRHMRGGRADGGGNLRVVQPERLQPHAAMRPLAHGERLARAAKGEHGLGAQERVGIRRLDEEGHLRPRVVRRELPGVEQPPERTQAAFAFHEHERVILPVADDRAEDAGREDGRPEVFPEVGAEIEVLLHAHRGVRHAEQFVGGVQGGVVGGGLGFAHGGFG